jgi:glycosyltransferase involved in cell wall biosynthesis
MQATVKLSVLMPVFNEEATLQAVLERVVAVDYPCEMELVVVDDASTDGTAKIIEDFHHPKVIKRRHSVNQGKGAAIRTAAEFASGDFVIPCDADLEYRPEEIPLLLEPILADDAEVVFGNRTFGSHSAYSFWYVMGNRGITTVANVLFNSYISDLETCYKLLPLKLYRELDIRSAGFGMEAEITAKLLSRGVRPYEVPISYRARGREDGKKITWWDGVEAIWIMTRIRLRPAS